MVRRITALRAKASRQTNNKAERWVSRKCCHGIGQQEIYREKERQARAYLADTTQDHLLFPYIVEEMAIADLKTAAAAAKRIVKRADEAAAWRIAVDSIRRITNQKVSRAKSEQEINQILDRAEWPNPETH